MTPRDAMIRQLSTKPCDVLTCEQRVPLNVECCAVHVDGVPLNDVEVAAAGRRAANELEWLLSMQPTSKEQ